MTFVEWRNKYGAESARKQFGLSDHMVIVVKRGKYVTGICGRWRGSQPLGMGQSVEPAIEKLEDAVANSYDTIETIYE